jgi:hypothetical protein
MNHAQVVGRSHWLRGSTVLILLAAIVGVLLLTGQLRILPFLLLLACPLMHLLMHRGHRGHNSDGEEHH